MAFCSKCRGGRGTLAVCPHCGHDHGSAPPGRRPPLELPAVAAVGVSAALYLAGCLAPALVQGHGPGFFPWNGTPADETLVWGVEALLLGWVAAFDVGGRGWPSNLAWLANPLALTAVVLLATRRLTAAAVCGCLAAGLALAFLAHPGEFYRPRELRPGAYLWAASLVALGLAGVLALRGRTTGQGRSTPG